jgi:hypothetical protein
VGREERGRWQVGRGELGRRQCRGEEERERWLVGREERGRWQVRRGELGRRQCRGEEERGRWLLVGGGGERGRWQVPGMGRKRRSGGMRTTTGGVAKGKRWRKGWGSGHDGIWEQG